MFEYADLAFKIFTFLIAMASGLYAFFASRRKDVDARQDDHEHRITSLEQCVANTPDRDDVNRLIVAITRVEGELTTMSAKMDGQKELLGRVENAVSIHQDHLLKGSGK